MHALAKFKNKPLDTSKVLVQASKDKIFTFYLPGYLRLNVKNFTSINLQNLQSQMNAAIIFSVYYGALPQHLINHLMKGLKLNFERDQTIQLTDQDSLITQAKRVKQTNMIHFYVKKIFHSRIESDVFWSPFEIIYTIFTVTIQSLVVGDTVIQINLMNHPNRLEKLYTSELDKFGNYSLAVNFIEAEYTNKGVKRRPRSMKHKQHNPTSKVDLKVTTEDIVLEMIDASGQFLIAENMGCFRHAHFIIPMYKMPMYSLSTIFIPLWLLGIINLGVFFQPADLGNRIQAIAGLMVAFAALIPTIRGQIPPHPGWIFIQYVVHLQGATSLLALFQSIEIRNEKDYSMDWRTNGFFLVSLVITALSVIYVVAMVLVHYLFWQKNYNKLQITEAQRERKLQTVRTNLALDEEKKKKMKISRMRENINNNRNSLVKFIRSEWKNEECDECFREIQKVETDSVFMELEEPQIPSYKEMSEAEEKQLTPQQRLRTIMKNVSMHVELDEDNFSDTAKGTLGEIPL